MSNAPLDGQLPPISATNSERSEGHGSSSALPTTLLDSIDKSDAILAYLERLDQSNQALTKRVVKLETSTSTASMPHNVRTRSTVPPVVFNSSQPATQLQYQVQGGNTVNSATNKPNFNGLSTKPSDALIPASSAGSQPPHQRLLQPTIVPTQAQFNTDGVLPSLSDLRQNQEISHSVNQVLVSYESQAQLEATQGKDTQRKSGRINNTDTVTRLPQFRWPNEGLSSVTGKKKVLYNKLTVSEWTAGQLSYIYLIQDPDLVKHAMVQTIQALKDATSMPLQAVRTAYAQSMHQVEQGTLLWQNITQWALN